MDHSTDLRLVLSLWTKSYSRITSPTHLDICNRYNGRRPLTSRLALSLHVQTQTILVMKKYHHLWVITTFVNQEIPPTPTYLTIFTVRIHSGMESSVKMKECVALIRTLLHGLESPYPPQRQMILKLACVYLLTVQGRKYFYKSWRFTFNEEAYMFA